MNGLLQDCRYALRQLRKNPGFTSVAVLTLALGIGANTAIYTLLDQALLRRLPVKQPDQLVLLRYSGADLHGYSTTRTDGKLYFSYPMYRDLRDHNSVLSGLIATDWASVGVQWHNQPELVDTELVSGNYFDVLGVQPAIGRLFVASDDVSQEANPVVVLSFDYWQQRFASDPEIVNQSISINGHPFTIIGVAQPGFHSAVGGDVPGLFAPMTMKPEITPGWNGLDERNSKWLNIIGRLKPGFTRAQAQAGIDPLWHSIRADELKQLGHSSERYQNEFLTNSHLYLDDGSKGVPVHGSVPTTLLVITGMAGLMVLMACANVGSLMLVRMAARTREISVRYALGAKRNRLIQQLLAEGALLSFAGGVGGLLLAPRIAPLLMRYLWARPSGGVRLAFSTQPDLRILLFTFGLALLVTLLFSLAPAVQCWRPDVTAALKQQAASVAGGSNLLRRASVSAQIGISLLLLIGAGLFVRTLHNLKTLNVGFATDHLVTFRVSPELAGYQQTQALALYEQVREKLASMPGVRSAAGSTDPELTDTNSTTNITIAGYHPAESEDMNVEWEWVSPGYLSTLKMPLLAGREIEEQDHAGTHKVAVVNESFARRYFGRPQDALGHYFCSGAGQVTPDIEIVGVTKDAKHTTVRGAIRRVVFLPYPQAATLGNESRNMTFYVRTWQEPKSAESTIRTAMHALDSKLVVDRLRTMQEQVDDNLINERVIAFLATSFGILAALMAAIGIYGVLAYATAQRTREIGVRIAVGATRVEVIRLVLTEVFWLAGAGIVGGIPLSLLLARAVREQLFGISTHDLPTLAVVCLAIAAVAFAAAALPARRAAKVDPMVALRYE
jgi:putative ABC transport system permease protein